MDLPIDKRPRFWCGRVALLLLTVVPVPGAWSQDRFEYAVQFQGELDEALRAELETASASVSLRTERPVVSRAHLERRATDDVEVFLALLHAGGRYDAAVSFTIDDASPPTQLTFHVDPGPQYILTRVEIQAATPGAPGITELPEPEELGLREGEAFAAQPVLDAEGRLLARLREQGHAFAAAPDRDVIVDHADHTVSVTFKIDPGPRSVFGPLEVKGLESVREVVVRKYVEWDEGAVYDERLVQETQRVLYRTGLFSTVRVFRAADAPVDGAVPMGIDVAERKHRTVSAGVQYRTDEGASLRLHWEHRNYRGLGRTLEYDAHLGQIQTSIETRYTFRRWRRDNQTLELSAHVGEWSPDAYTSRRIGARAWVERDLDGPWSVGTGLTARWDEIEQQDESEQYHLLSNPWRLTWDTIDDPLDPTDGQRITLSAEPFAGVGGGALFFAKSEVQYSEYFPLDDAKDWLLAVRGRVGLSAGAGHDEMPPDERFYAGGAASIRGYAYQTVGPLDDDDPLGGRSAFDMSLELRRRITKDIGIVVFVDGGSAFEETFPTFSDLHWGAGVGLRYYTGIGPIGLDVAVPLNKRGFDDSFQVYITLGQAF